MAETHQHLEAALFSIDEGGIRLVGRTQDARAVAATREAIASRQESLAAEIRDLRSARLSVVRKDK